jgi:6-pyruvoyltetrahydropterin/6-carboxytetrahydropterin synthase
MAAVHRIMGGLGRRALYEVTCETTFNATHRLISGGQPIEPQHGHDWRVEAVVAGRDLDQAGMLVDFVALKRALDETAAALHHQDLNARPELVGQSPSAEVVARHFFDEIARRLGSGAQALARVRVEEAPGCSATYAQG